MEYQLGVTGEGGQPGWYKLPSFSADKLLTAPLTEILQELQMLSLAVLNFHKCLNGLKALGSLFKCGLKIIECNLWDSCFHRPIFGKDIEHEQAGDEDVADERNHHRNLSPHLKSFDTRCRFSLVPGQKWVPKRRQKVQQGLSTLGSGTFSPRKARFVTPVD